MRKPNPTCAVCGHVGYWVAWSSKHSENRCVNHLNDDKEADDGE